MAHGHRWLIGTAVVLALAAALALISGGVQPSLAENGVIYVNADAGGANTGTSWTDAYTNLQLALSDADPGQQIWVAAGTYKPTGDTDRTASFQLVNGVAIYGGFAGNEALLTERDWVANLTILSGDIGIEGDDFDNVYHVLRAIEITELAVLDGLTITGGNANATTNYDDEYGGGLFAYAAELRFENLRVQGNTAQEWGGGLYINGSHATLANVTFSGNSASHGGGFCVNNSEATLTNCTFSGNSAGNFGGALYNYNASPSLTNCILWGDTPQGIYNADDTSTPAVSYSDIQGGCGAVPYNVCGDGNIDDDPLFLDPDNGDYHLGLGSPAIDAGDSSAAGLTGIITDLGGNPRFAGLVDMGAYEAPHNPLFVDLDAAGADDGTSWDDALIDLQVALAWAQDSVDIWVAEGTYKPTSGTERTISFQMVNGVAIYGGFDPSAGDDEWDERDWEANLTVLSGDIGIEGSPDDNSYHVFYHPDGTGLDDTAILDGFTITGGNANGTNPHNRGGGMYNYDSSPALTNCTFEGNSAEYAGGMYNADYCSPIVTNCTFSGNSAAYNGGGMMNGWSTNPTLTNCIFWGNSGGGIYGSEFSGPVLTNCILWNNSPYQISSLARVTYSDIQGGWDEVGNIDADPLFADPDNSDFHLGPGSPCIDAGSNSAPDLPGLDFEGDYRVLDGDLDGTAIVDMGVDEHHIAYYVDADAQGGDNGSTWEDAFTALQPALDLATAGDEILVAAGTYTPTAEHGGTGPRYRSFQMKNEVAIYGGFDPSVGDVAWEDRDWAANPTILSGDIGEEGNPDDNAYHVFYHPDGTGLDTSAILDGFTITGGNANHPSDTPFRIGGGMVNTSASPALLNCTFSNNSAVSQGGGIYNWSSAPVLTNCTFSGNSASYGGGMNNTMSSPELAICRFSGNSAADEGGGMRNFNNSSPSLTNCQFYGNSAGTDGGGMFNEATSSPTLVNCTFLGNLAGADGGGMLNSGSSSPNLTNCTFWDNSASQGGGIYNAYDSSPTLTNCILWGGSPSAIVNADDTSTPAISYSDIQGGCDADPYNVCGDGNIAADPLLLDPDNGDYHLGPGSLCIDAGDSSAPGLVGIATDLGGNPRFAGVVDMGAYEAPHNPLFVDLEAAGADDGTSWEDALIDLQVALAWAQDSVEIWVAAGTYTPTWQFDGSDPRSAAFQMKNGVAIYGGFDPSAGNDTWGERDWVLHESILSGDIGNPGDAADNSYHVFYHPEGLALDSTAILDGFTITGGNANGDSPHNGGGGMYNDGSSPALTNLTFAGNSGRYVGGMCNDNASPELTNCTFVDNWGDFYGGMYNSNSSSPTLTNCTFTGNSAIENGGGITNYHSSPTLTNCILWGDVPPEIYNVDEGSTPAINYSNIQGSGTYPGTGNINADPLFLDPDNGDYHLGLGSLCIDAGDSSAPGLVGIATDLGGNPRFAGVVDMGAYEAPHNPLFVNLEAAGADDGTSWEDALIDLQVALAWAQDSVEIWVAAGTYTPTWQFDGSDPRSAAFQMKNGVAIYGGFDPSAGDDTWGERDWVLHETILSGDIGNPGDAADNSYHVFYHPEGLALDNTAILDGFTITGGNASGDYPHYRGGGMYNLESSPTLTNCTFEDNSASLDAGGMLNWVDSWPILTNCTFKGNSSNQLGGAMFNIASAPVMTNVVFIDNSARDGGGMYNHYSSPSLTDCTFSGNSASRGGGMCNADSSQPELTNVTFIGNTAAYWGGGMRNYSSNPTLTNVTFTENTAGESGGGIYSYSSSPTLANCILWGDTAAGLPDETHNADEGSTTTVSYSDIQGGCDADPYNVCGDGNIDDDPLFVDAGNGDLHLRLGSPCIDAGTSGVPDPPGLPETDFEGDARIIDGDGDGDPVVDMGVDEARIRIYLPLVLRAY